jgi:hypothetical protein
VKLLSNFAKQIGMLPETMENVVAHVIVDELPSQIIIHLFNNQNLDLTVSTHFGAICPKWRASSEIGAKSF